MSKRPAFLLLIVWVILSAACALTSPAAPTSPPTLDTPLGGATPVPVIPGDTATAIPSTLASPTPLQPTDTPTEIPPTLTPTPTSTSTALPPTPSSPEEVYQAVSAAWKKLAQAGPYHVTQIGYMGDTPFQQTDIDITNQFTVSVDQASGLVVKQVILSKVTKTEQTITYDPSITLTLPDEAKNGKIKK